jgi:hypothetical protein
VGGWLGGKGGTKAWEAFGPGKAPPPSELPEGIPKSETETPPSGKEKPPVDEPVPPKAELPPKPAADQIKDLPELTGKSRTEIEETLKNEGYSKVPSNDGSGSVWTKQGSDGNTSAVRLDPATVRTPPKGFADEVPHAHKENVPTNEVQNGNYKSPSSRLNDKGEVPSGNKNQSKRDQHIPILWK